MRKLLLALFAIVSLDATAQDFEGLIKWAIKVEFTDPYRQQMMEEAKKADAENERREMLIQAPADSVAAEIQGTPAKNKNLGGGGIPTAMIVKTKKKNSLTSFEGGRKINFLYLNDEDKTYNIDFHRKTYHELPYREKIPANAPGVNAQFVKSEETAVILEYNCTKYTKTFTHRDKQVTQELWVTTEITDLNLKPLDKVRINGQLIPFDKIDGVPLKMVVVNSEGTFSMVATLINRTEIEDKVFTFPKGFKENKVAGNSQR